MKHKIGDLLCNVIEEMEDHFEVCDVSTETLRLHMNFSLVNTLFAMCRSSENFVIDDKVVNYIDAEFDIDLVSASEKFIPSSRLTIKQVYEAQAAIDSYFTKKESADSDYEYPVEYWISHILMRATDGCSDQSLYDDDYLLSVYDTAIEQCKSWMLYDDSKIAEIEDFAENRFAVGC